ncbi:MAG: SufS family cysteine desulfurase [Simkaniaceae bacterium]|nr:SufS family cysteine desulfurase [Simkaniaceae bacterium]
MDSKKIRDDFPGLRTEIYGKPLVYFDNAATSQKPKTVIDAVMSYYTDYTANVHRGIYYTSEKATYNYELVREKTAKFINAPSEQNIIFTKGTTESINLVAYAWARKHLKPGDEILVTEMEHHSNLVPWQLAAQDTGAALTYIPLGADGLLDLSTINKLLNQNTKLLAITHQSNVLGTVNPIKELVQKAHAVGAVVLVDAAQSVPHQTVDVQDLNCDFLAFSGHKMLAPTGVGVLYGKMEILEDMNPFHGGGEMINRVTMQESTWNDVPYRFEAGTPNIAQVIGLGAAIDYLDELGMDAVHHYEQELLQYASKTLSGVEGITIFGPEKNRGSVIPFIIEGIHAADLAQFLDQDGIAIRAGHHCAQPIMDKLGVSSTARASFYLYNTKDEIDYFVQSLNSTKKYFI